MESPGGRGSASVARIRVDQNRMKSFGAFAAEALTGGWHRAIRARKRGSRAIERVPATSRSRLAEVPFRAVYGFNESRFVGDHCVLVVFAAFDVADERELGSGRGALVAEDLGERIG